MLSFAVSSLPFIGGFLKKNWKIVLIASAIIAIVWAVNNWKESIKAAAFDQFYAEQVAEKMREKDQVIADLVADQKLKERVIISLREDKEESERATQQILDDIKSKKFTDGPVPEVLSRTIEALAAKSRSEGDGI